MNHRGSHGRWVIITALLVATTMAACSTAATTTTTASASVTAATTAAAPTAAAAVTSTTQGAVTSAVEPEGEVAAPQPPVEFTGRIACGPPVSAARAGDSETLAVGDEDMVLTRYRDGAWRQIVTMTDPRLEGTVYHTWESDTYAMQGAEGAGVWTATHRIENEAGAWEGRDYGGTFSDGTAIGDEAGIETDDTFAAINDSVWIGEGAYAGLIAMIESTPFEAGCGVDVRGIIFDGAPVPQPFVPNGG